MTRPKLSYFDFPGGRGEECRLALHVAGVDFDDHRVPGREWAEFKPSTPFGAMPVFELDGRKLWEANAILGYIGRRYGTHPTDLWEAARHDAVMGAVEDLRHEIDPTVFVKDADEKKRMREVLVAGPIPRWATNMEQQIQGPFVGGADLCVADLKLFVVLNWVMRGVLDHIPRTTFDAYPKLVGLHAAVRSDPRVQAWYTRFPGALPA